MIFSICLHNFKFAVNLLPLALPVYTQFQCKSIWLPGKQNLADLGTDSVAPPELARQEALSRQQLQKIGHSGPTGTLARRPNPVAPLVLARQAWAVAPACLLAQNGMFSHLVGATEPPVAPPRSARQEFAIRECVNDNDYFFSK